MSLTPAVSFCFQFIEDDTQKKSVKRDPETIFQKMLLKLEEEGDQVALAGPVADASHRVH